MRRMVMQLAVNQQLERVLGVRVPLTEPKIILHYRLIGRTTGFESVNIGSWPISVSKNILRVGEIGVSTPFEGVNMLVRIQHSHP